MDKTLKIFVDSDAFVASVKADDSNYEKTKRIFQDLKKRPVKFITSNYVFSESITVISQRVSYEGSIGFIKTIKDPEGIFLIERINEIIEELAIEIFKKQTSKNTSFVDCTNIALIKEKNIDAIF